MNHRTTIAVGVDGSWADNGAVDWALPARTVWHHARAVTPWPGATAGFGGRRLIVLASCPETGGGESGTVLEVRKDGVVVACGEESLRMTKVKPEGRGEQPAAEWARGARLEPGMRMQSGKEYLS